MTEYPKKECPMHGYLIQHNPPSKIYIFVKKTNNLEIVFISIFGNEYFF